MCTLLIIGILQGLGIDPKNHGPLGYQRENEEEEEEPVLHLVLEDEIVDLDNLPIIVNNETEIQYQNEVIAPNTPAVPVQKAPVNFMDDGLSEEEDDPNNSSIHSDSHKRKITEEDLDLFSNISLPHSKKGRNNKGSSPRPQSRSPTPPTVKSPSPVPVPKSPSPAPSQKSQFPTHSRNSLSSPPSPKSPSPPYCPKSPSSPHRPKSPSPASGRAGGGDQQGSEEQGSPSSTGSSDLRARLARLRSLSPTKEGEPLQLNKRRVMAPHTDLRTDIPPKSPSPPPGPSHASRPARPKGYPCRGCGKSFTSKVKRTYHYEDNRQTCGETIKTDKIFSQF